MDESDLRAVTGADVGGGLRASTTAWLVVAAVFAAHGVTLAGGFVYDDLWVVVHNAFVKDPGQLGNLWQGALPDGVPDGNRPTAVTLYMLDHALFGLAPWGWHLHNLLWHLASALSVTWLARQLAGEAVARSAGLLFAVHALLTEAVAAVNYREDLVATAAIVLAMALVVSARGSGRKAPIAFACVALFVGGNAKEVAPIFPLLLVAHDVCFARGPLREFLRRDGWTYLPLTLAAFASRFWLDALFQPEVLTTVQGAEALPPLAALATAGRITLAYLGQLLLPIHLSADYAARPEAGLGLLSGLGLLAVLALAGSAVAFRRGRPVVAFGLFWLLVALLPTSGIVPVQNLRADRYVYLPSVGFLLAAAWWLVAGCERLAASRSPVLAGRLLPAALALLCLVYGGLAVARNLDWRDEASLWEATVRTTPQSHRAHVGLMSEYLRQGRLEEAERVGRAALQDHPRSWQLHLNLGQVQAMQGHPRQARTTLERAASLGGAGDPRLIDNLALAHFQSGDAKQALTRLREGAERWPRDARIQQHLGQIAFAERDFPLAARALEAAVALEPGDVESQHTLARALLRLGRVEAAEAAVNRALELAPEHTRSLRLAERIARQAKAPARDTAATDATPTGTVDAEELDRLRALGYLEFADEVVADDESPVSEHDPERSAPGYNLVMSRGLSRADLVDADGRVLRSWSDPQSVAWSNAELTPSGHLLVQGVRGRKRLYLAKLGFNGRVVWRRWIAAHHDVERTPDGRLAVLTLEGRPVPELHPTLPLLDNGIAVLDGNGEPLESYSLYDMLAANPEAFTFQPVAPTELSVDLLHSNSVEFMRHPHLAERSPLYAPTNAIVSFRHQDTVAIFDLAARKVVWAWGQGEISGPHDATVLENGNVLLFDNGLGRGWSRVVEVEPQSREIVWEYRAPDPASFYSASEGSSQRLPNGNTLVANSDSGEAFEVTTEGDVVWRWHNPNTNQDGRRATIVRIKRYPAAMVDAFLAASGPRRP